MKSDRNGSSRLAKTSIRLFVIAQNQSFCYQLFKSISDFRQSNGYESDMNDGADFRQTASADEP